MPAVNMMGPLIVPANPSGGTPVTMSPFSGPKGSPFDAKRINPTTGLKEADPTNYSTGALSTGIGLAYSSPVTNAPSPAGIRAAGYTDDYTPGLSLPGPTVAFPTGLAQDARLLAIGGGRSVITPGPGNTGLGVSVPSPYAAQPIMGFGNGGSRDGGAGPAFTGFAMKMVTAAADVVTGAAIEAGWINRALSVAQTGYPGNGSPPVGRTMVAGQSAFGSATAAFAPVTLLEVESEELEEEEEFEEEEEEEEPE